MTKLSTPSHRCTGISTRDIRLFHIFSTPILLTIITFRLVLPMQTIARHSTSTASTRSTCTETSYPCMETASPRETCSPKHLRYLPRPKLKRVPTKQKPKTVCLLPIYEGISEKRYFSIPLLKAIKKASSKYRSLSPTATHHGN